MKKSILLIALLFTQISFAQVVDVFNYTGALNANGWTTHSGTAGQIITTTSSLSYPGLAASTGNKAVLANGTEDVNIPLSGITGTGYTSMIMSVPSTANTSTAAGGAYFYGFGGTAGGTLTILWARLWIKQGVATNTFKLGISNSGNATAFTTAEYAINTPVFVVVSLDTTVSPHVAKLYVNPTPGAAAPVATLTDNTNTGAFASFASIFIRQSTGTGDIEIDEIRAGSTFASVTPAGASGCNLLNSGITALTCNDAGTGSVPADDYLTFSLNPTGLTLGTTYTVSVPSGTITPTTGTYGSATSFQLQAGSAGAGNVTVTISDNSTMGCTMTQIITDPGACSSAIPVISLTPDTLSGFDHLVGTPSAEQTFTASGLGLTGNITISAPTNFQISLTPGTGFTNSIVLTQTAGAVPSTTIHARANAAAAGNLAGNIIATSNGAVNDTVYVFGTASDYTYYTIDQISTVNSTGVADSLNVLVELTGTIYCMDFDGNSGYSLTMIDGSGSGINVFNFANVSGYNNPLEGDSLRVFGKIEQFNGLLEVFADSIEVLDQGVAIMAPTVVTTLDETTESQYISMKLLSLVTPMATFGTGSTNVNVTDGVNTFVMRIDSDTDIPGTPAPQGLFNVTGIGGQFDNSSPYDSGYQLFPCGVSSFVDTCIPPSNMVSTTSTTATATATGANITYQWVDCSNNLPINGATNQSFTATTSGSYLVMITEGNCSTNSACVALTGTFGIEENNLSNSIRVYPNPVIDELNIENTSNTIISFEIMDVNGRVVSNGNTFVKSTAISTSLWEKGVYFLKFSSKNGETTIKIVK